VLGEGLSLVSWQLRNDFNQHGDSVGAEGVVVLQVISPGFPEVKEVGAGDVGVGIDEMQDGQGKVPGDKHPGDEALPLVA